MADMMHVVFFVMKALLEAWCESVKLEAASLEVKRFEVGGYSFQPNPDKMSVKAGQLLWAQDKAHRATIQAWSSGKVYLTCPEVEEFDVNAFQDQLCSVAKRAAKRARSA